MLDHSKLIAIDIHTEHSCRQPLDPIQAQFEDAASAYFKTEGKRPTIVRHSGRTLCDISFKTFRGW